VWGGAKIFDVAAPRVTSERLNIFAFLGLSCDERSSISLCGASRWDNNSKKKKKKKYKWQKSIVVVFTVVFAASFSVLFHGDGRIAHGFKKQSGGEGCKHEEFRSHVALFCLHTRVGTTALTK
jgi:hypothetical protein